MSGANRLARRFDALKDEGRAGLVTFLMAGDPDAETFEEILAALPGAGADVIEIGMPFSDPMADGPAIQLAGQRALKSGQNMDKTLAMVERFRRSDGETPIVLMGYFNPLYIRGVETFVLDAERAGVDGLIIVDLPPEEDDELRPAAKGAGIELIRLVAPTTSDERLERLMVDSGGFVYYVSVTGVTGTHSAAESDIASAMARIRNVTDLPVAVGFGIRDAASAAGVARHADAAVVGSAIVQTVAGGLDDGGRAKPGLVDAVTAFVGELAQGVRNARS